jgi:hypothetical protein
LIAASIISKLDGRLSSVTCTMSKRTGESYPHMAARCSRDASCFVRAIVSADDRSRGYQDFGVRFLPSPATKPPAGAGWLHEIKHDGFRMLVRRDKAGVRLFTRNGHDWTGRFPLIERAALSLKAASCLIDGEAVACDDDGLPVFDRLRYRRDDRRVFL